ncbi:unnamed protein product [Paramecium primaurelia]|uniref:Uncharacterized protein n=1 Tax=Paramecium primaurelia TaxID=5886 RepID=A0A8S1P1W7_PARPR|nr:unnamed protein product [Paramecium primaurelia]
MMIFALEDTTKNKNDRSSIIKGFVINIKLQICLKIQQDIQNLVYDIYGLGLSMTRSLDNKINSWKGEIERSEISQLIVEVQKIFMFRGDWEYCSILK